MKKILVLINPKSRSGAQAQTEAVELLKAAGYEILQPSLSEDNADPNSFILQHSEECECVLIGGGDGSVNAALPALVKTQLPLLVFPLGTANNLARTYNIPAQMPQCVELLKNGRQLQVDLGTVNDIYFVNVAGLGLSTEVNRSVSPKFKRHLGVFAFVFTALRVAFHAKPFRAEIHSDTGKVESRSWQISVCNGRHYGNGLTIEKNASLVDGKLHCLSTEVPNLWRGLRLIPALLSGHYRYDHEVTLVEGTRVEIKTRKPMRIDVDGDIKTRTPAVFEVHRRQLKLIVPKDESQELPIT